MIYKYLAFGLSVSSEIELPALMPDKNPPGEAKVKIRVGDVPVSTLQPCREAKPFTSFNGREFIYSISGTARYYVKDGTEIIIQPESEDWSSILLYFYSNCLAAVLFQRNLIPFHVSGVFVAPGKVLLFAAPSRTGKSTTAVMLAEKGYSTFTDDTAILSVENGKCYAYASYPMARLWQNSLTKQSLYREEDKRAIRDNVMLQKYGFHFHDSFVSGPVEVSGIVFLEEAGADIVVETIKASQGIQLLGSNIYRNHWIKGMGKGVLQFKTLTAVVNCLNMWKAVRPKGKPTFQAFADAIEAKIIWETPL